MAFDLNRTLSWTAALAAQHPQDAATLAMLSDLQGNILKGHGRDNTVNYFLSFDAESRDIARTFVAGVGASVTTALDQLTGAQVFKATRKDAGPFVAFFLSSSGYGALGLEDAAPPEESFRAGLKARVGLLDDPEPQTWEGHFASEVHAMVLLAADDETQLSKASDELDQKIASTGGAVRLLGVEVGRAVRNSDTQGIEHFGYVDGRSQPLFLEEDLAKERLAGTDKWDPKSPLKQVLVRCPGGKLEVSHGSYFVFRKLEQNVREFKQRELDLAEAYGGIGEIAGAYVVGRFENGTPVIESSAEVPVGHGSADVPNNFNYSADVAGVRCPYAGHIRKTNPREVTTHEHLMARRGIPYGDRTDDPNDGHLENKPAGGVGLLFMAYQESIENQFEFTQRLWANNSGFDFKSANQPVGIDPVIGQSNAPQPQQYPKVYGKELGERFDFSGFVTMKGGEYFFAPSVSFLKSLD